MKYLLSLALVLFVAACSHSHKDSKIQQDVEITSNYKAQAYSDIHFGGQPPLNEFEKLKSQGFATVVNLRQPTEKGYKAADEKKAAEAAGLNYVHIPMSGKAPLTDDKISSITKSVVKTRKEGKTLVHCSSGNRAALWAGGHFYKDHGYDKTASMGTAKQLGLNNSVLLKNLEKYLENK